MLQVQFKSGKQCRCKQCDTRLSIVDSIPQMASVLLVIVTVPIWLFVLFTLMAMCLDQFDLRGQIWSVWVISLTAVTALTWCFAGWPICLDYLLKRVESWVPTCHKCGYNLTVMTDNTCPECGTVYDPDFVPLLERVIWQFKFTRKGFKYAVIIGISLFVLVFIGNVIYQHLKEIKTLTYGWPLIIYYPKIYHGRPIHPWDNIALVVNLILCLFAGMVIESIRYNILLMIERRRKKKQGG